MSALARWFKINGFEVAGYDRTPTALTDTLQKEGIPVHFEDAIALIPADFLQNSAQTLVVLTPAVPADHLEYNYLTSNGFTIQKRSQVLGLNVYNWHCGDSWQNHNVVHDGSFITSRGSKLCGIFGWDYPKLWHQYAAQ